MYYVISSFNSYFKGGVLAPLYNGGNQGSVTGPRCIVGQGQSRNLNAGASDSEAHALERTTCYCPRTCHDYY